jgi:hypothetical protein
MQELLKTEENGSGVPAVQSTGTAPADSNVSNSEDKNLCLQSPVEGLPSNRCRRCGRTLTAESSKQHGYGDFCLSKVRNGDLRRAKILKQTEPRTVTDDTWAQRTIKAIYSLINKITPESAGWNARCAVCGTTIHQMPLESFDHDGGMTLPGFGNPQWFYLHDDHNDLAIWKLRIYDADIMAELERRYPGQVPGHNAVSPLAHVRPTIIEEALPEASRMFISSVQALDRRVTEEPVAGVVLA